jgi:D-serine deaminase-like pyridoxal phosphate-dependent protein
VAKLGEAEVMAEAGLDDILIANQVLDVFIEVDTGKGRCGLTGVDEIIALADKVARTSNLRLRGVETHEGHVAGTASSEEAVGKRAIAAGERIVEVAEVLRTRGQPE